MQQYECDVLIIGAGGAGLRAALEIMQREQNARVILVTKGRFGKSGVTATACSDRMAFHVTLAFTEPGGKDNWKYHAEDIYRIGGYVSDRDLAEILARNSQEAFEYLDKLGVPWARKKGRPDQFLTDGSKYARACYTGPYTAIDIEKTLAKKIKDTSVKIIENVMIVDLVSFSSENRVIGAFGLDKEENPIVFKSKATILATGGAGGIFAANVYPRGMTGDGYAMAYRAGAELVNMEFIQIGLSSIDTKLACSGSMMRAIPRFVNDKGEEFLSKYFPSNTSLSEVYLTIFQKGSSWPVSFEHESCFIDLAVFKEIREGRKVYLDYTTNPKSLKWEKLDQVLKWYREVKNLSLENIALKDSPWVRLQRINPEVVSWFERKEVNLGREKVEIAPAAQHFQGGVKIRENAQTTLEGLYAVGECAGGQHGANRPGGNALLDCQVFGKIAGMDVIEEAKTVRSICLKPSFLKKMKSNIEALKNNKKRGSASLVRTKIQKTLLDFAGLIRTKEGLETANKELKNLEEEGVSADKKGLIFALETLNILKVAQMVICAASLRKESRGPHLYFHSFEDIEPLARDDENWCKYIVIKQSEKDMEFGLRNPVR